MTVGEAIRPGDLCVARNGRVFRFRSEPCEEVLGVATTAAAPGEPEPHLIHDLDTIMDALQIDFANRN